MSTAGLAFRARRGQTNRDMVEHETSGGSRNIVVPFKVVLVSIVGLWACYYGLTTLRMFLGGMDHQLEMAALRAVVTLAGIGITLGLWLIIRLFDKRPLWAKVTVALVVAFPLAIASAKVNSVVFADMEARFLQERGDEAGVAFRRDRSGNLIIDVPGLEDSEEAGPAQSFTLQAARNGFAQWQQLIAFSFDRYFMLLAWCALYFALLSIERARAAERSAGEFRQAAKAAELRSLRYQVNPHFLFNTLNSISALILTDKKEQAEEMVQAMANFYRTSLTDDPTADLSLEEEFALQRHYLDIESVRFPNRLLPEFDLPAELKDMRIPGMILQPLVENSVKYAVAPTSKPVTIAICAREEYGRLVLSVEDNGSGVADDAEHGYGIGLDNVRQRLEARFGRDAHMVSGPSAKGYATHLRVPLEKNGQA